MSIVLKVSNSSLLQNAKNSFLNNNYSSGVTTLVVTNSAGFNALDYLLIGEFGNETSEIVQIAAGGVNTTTHTLTLVSATKFSHAESTKITILKYNQVRFYRTTTTTFSASSPVTGYLDIQPDSLFTIGYDTTNTTGYGWGLFYNETTLAVTVNSNYIPYVNFGVDTVKKLIERFYSRLSITEQKLITTTEVMSFLSEAYSVARNELNLSNKEYNAEDAYDLATVAATAEYALPTNCSQVLSIWNDDNDREIASMQVKDAEGYNNNSSNITKYYLRGNFIGLVPTPTAVVNYKVRYLTKSAVLTSYSDIISLPNNNSYILINYVMYLAAPRLKRTDGLTFYKMFFEDINRLKIGARRDGGTTEFGISPECNV